MAYAIGVSHPLSISLFTYGSSQKSQKELLQIVNRNFDLRPGIIVRFLRLRSQVLFCGSRGACLNSVFIGRDLDLKRPIYQRTACYGHFGRKDFPWEVPKNLNL